jgi:2-methylisocitrate lyase-like PEP mutase family enzyme
MKKTTMLRKQLEEPGLLRVPCIYDCITARCAEAVGFKAVFMSGLVIRTAVFGVPDIGLATATEAVNIMRYIANSVNIPLIVDADDGYGNALAAYQLTQAIIGVGAAGLFIDDQTNPSYCPGILGPMPKVVSRDVYFGKISAVLEARNKLDKDFVVIARTDAGNSMGEEEVLARAKACVKLGADVILPMPILPTSKFFGKRTKETLKQLYKTIGAPIWGGGPFDFTAKDYEEVGAKMMVNGGPVDACTKAALIYLQKFYDTGVIPTDVPPEGPSWDNYNKLKGLDFWANLEKKYVPQ